MSDQPVATRRAFLAAGAMIAVPVGVPVAVAGGGFGTRPARAGDEAAVRALHDAWLREVNRGAVAPRVAGGAVRAIAADRHGAPDSIELTADARRAAGRFHCAVEVETELAPDCTLAQMAHAQGTGFVRATERRVLEVDYVRIDDGWMIARTEFLT